MDLDLMSCLVLQLFSTAYLKELEQLQALTVCCNCRTQKLWASMPRHLMGVIRDGWPAGVRIDLVDVDGPDLRAGFFDDAAAGLHTRQCQLNGRQLDFRHGTADESDAPAVPTRALTLEGQRQLAKSFGKVGHNIISCCRTTSGHVAVRGVRGMTCQSPANQHAACVEQSHTSSP